MTVRIFKFLLLINIVIYLLWGVYYLISFLCHIMELELQDLIVEEGQSNIESFEDGDFEETNPKNTLIITLIKYYFF